MTTTTRDSGFIDLFAISSEAAAAVPAAAPSAPPPGVSFDVGDDIDVDVFAAAQQKANKRMKVIGAAIGGVAILGILIAAISSGGSTVADKPQAAAAVAAPIAAAPIPEPAVAPPPVTPAPPPTAKGKPDYTPATAAAAYASVNAKKHPAKAVKRGGAKLQKIQSSGTGT